MKTNSSAKVDHIVYIKTDEHAECEECHNDLGHNKFADAVNHYIQKHHYELLHIGPETTKDNDSNIFHLTVAVLGKR